MTEQHQTMRDAAIAWHLRVSQPEADEAAFADFTAWLESDPAHRQAFDAVEAFADAIDAVALLSSLREPAARVSDLGQYRARKTTESHFHWRWWLASAGTLAGAAAVLAFLLMPAREPASQVFATRIGETREIALADGSHVNLNTDTSLHADVGQDRRHVTLDHGEALFRIAHDTVHPFFVKTGAVEIRVVGTVFNVARHDGEIAVTVAEGKVDVRRPVIGKSDGKSDVKSGGTLSGEETTLRLHPGEQLVFVENSGGTTLTRVDPLMATSWSRGYLVFRDAPLSKVVSELNHYFTARIVIANADVGARRFTGVLRLDSEPLVLKHISQFLPVDFAYRPDGTVSLHAMETRP